MIFIGNYFPLVLLYIKQLDANCRQGGYITSDVYFRIIKEIVIKREC